MAIRSKKIARFVSAALVTITIFILQVVTSNKSRATIFTRKSAEEKLYPILYGTKWGYINENGLQIIKPKFLSALDFSEGLAPVREKGTYGYINKEGKQVIADLFDYAEPFHNGIAEVYINGKPYFIDKLGKTLFDHNFYSIEDFKGREFTVAKTQSGRTCLVDIKGNLLTDTIFEFIGNFQNGIAVVAEYHKPNKKKDYFNPREKVRCGVIDSTGNWIIPLGRYDNISPFINGFAIAEFENIKEKGKVYANTQCIVNSSGEQKFIVPAKKWHFDYLNPCVSENISIVKIYTVNPDTVKIWKDEYTITGAVDINGSILFENKDWKSITPFSCGRAFAQLKTKNWILIDINGNQVCNRFFDDVLFNYGEDNLPLFRYGKAFVRCSNYWTIIDTYGQSLINSPKLIGDFSNPQLFEDKLVFVDRNSENCCLWNPVDSLLLTSYKWIKTSTIDDPLIRVGIDENHWGYVNHSGKIIWQNDASISDQANLNIDFMNRGYFFASSPSINALNGLGGWGGSENIFKKMDPIIKSNGRELQITIDTTRKTVWENQYNGFAVYIVNSSNDTSYFPAQDSRLEMKLQAKNKEEKWQDIEYLPNSWCGNSYHKLFLPPQNYWEFSIPDYQGALPTKIRAVLYYHKKLNQKEYTMLISNEIDGHVNPGQFWRKMEYFPNGIMDSYSE